MPITKSAKKSLRSSLAKRAANQKTLLALEIALKKVDAKNIADVMSKIDKAAKNKLLSMSKAARIKSRISRKLKVNKPAKKSTSKTSVKAKAAPKVTKKKTSTK